MANVAREIMLQSLANTIKDYRQDEIVPITPGHVEAWLDQFDVVDQLTILNEIDSIMKRFYFSKFRVKECLRNFIKNEVVGRNNPFAVLTTTCFLRVQTTGDSQRALLEIVDEIIQEDYGLSVAACGQDRVETYVYIDDAIYTGNRLIYDLVGRGDNDGWLKSQTPYGCKLIVYALAVHLFALNRYVEPKVRPICREKRIALIWKRSLFIDNTTTSSSSVEHLWPERIVGDQAVETYISNLQATLVQYNQTQYELFRKMGIPVRETFFSSSHARAVVEHAFLKYGVRIATASRSPVEQLRPLGYSKLTNLGFGTLFITYRNIANNCPLVLWWGDKTMPSYHPFSMWHPLFPRVTNELRGSSSYDILDDEHPF